MQGLNSQNYVLLDQLLFKLIMVPDKEKALLAIPESYADKIISLFHNSLFAGHQGVIKMSMSRLSMELKVMPRSQKGHLYILCVIDKVINYLVTGPLYQARSEEIGEGLIEHIITKYGTPEYMMMDQDSAFMSSLMNYLFKVLSINTKTVGPYNHKFLQPEHGIKSLSNILTKHLTQQGQTCHKFLSIAMLPIIPFTLQTSKILKYLQTCYKTSRQNA